MTDPNTPDQKPAGRTPAEAAKPSQSAYLSPRLREKLETSETSTDDWPPKGGSRLPAILIAVAALAVAVGGFMGWRSIAQKQKAKEIAAARAESLATAARAESLALAARADSAARSAADSAMGAHGRGPAGGRGGEPPRTAGATATSAGSSGKPAASGAPASGSAAARPAASGTPGPPTEGYGIVVGTFLLEDRAQSERDRLNQTTGLAGIVAATDDGYRVILGKFTGRAAAEKKAAALADSGLVREAFVVPRPK